MDRRENDDQKKVDKLSIRDLSKRIVLNLRGSLRNLRDGYCIEVQNPELDSFIWHSVTSAQKDETGSDLILEAGSIREKTAHSKLELTGIEHLYVTWDTPKLISFCFIHEDRFNLINIDADTTFEFINGVDRRQKSSIRIDKKTLAKRRTFYHIGKEPSEEKAEKDDEAAEIEELLEEEEDDNNEEKAEE